MVLEKYRAKRNLKVSKEPKAKLHKRKAGKPIFVVQKHAATRLHYDFRLEVHGVLKSWAVPKGPSLNPKDKRLAVMVEDHPYDYKDFEGVIPHGYGAGTVMLWDTGTYTVEQNASKESQNLIAEGIAEGEIHFTLEGKKLKGSFTLVRINREKDEWLLIKKKDEFASDSDILASNRSVVSGATLEQIGSKRVKPEISDKYRAAPKAKMPHNVVPMLATLIDAPFNHPDWLFELKMDGFRALAEVKKKSVYLYSRNLQPFNERFPQIIEDLKALNVEAVFDGEIVVLDQKRVPRFQLIQNIQRNETPNNLFYFIFDLIYFQGYDLRSLPLIERKEILRTVLASAPETRLRYNDHIEEKGIDFFQASVKNDLEGIMGKRKASPYLESRRTKEWVKIKRHLRQEAIICGFTRPKGSRKEMGALLLGLYRKGELIYIGRVGGGFTEKDLKEVKELLTPLIQKKCPFKNSPTKEPITWVKPHYLCEVVFSEWTAEGLMRQPVFLGIREDKFPKAVTKEEPIEVEKVVKKEEKKKTKQTRHAKKVELSHLDKLYFPKDKITKGDVIAYYEAIAPYLLPHLKDRPESLKRFPEGIEGESFFQKNLEYYPSWVKTYKIKYKDRTINYLLIQDLDSLLYAANLGCIELHPFFSRIRKIDYPDFLVFDLDPEAVSFDKVIEVAHVLHETLEEFDIPSVCKTSGATGLHVCVPLQAKYTYEQAKQFSHLIALITQKKIPKISSLERSPQKRQKKVYIDYLQNNPGQTIASAYSVRARPGAPVSTPLEWSELVKGLRPLDFTIHNTLKRLKKVGDLFKPMLGKGISLNKILKKIEG